MSILELKHGIATRLPGVAMEDQGITDIGQLIQEIDFLTRHILPFKHLNQKPCILYPCTGKDRARLIQRMFMDHAFMYMYSIRDGIDEQYDPDCYKCGYRYSVDLTPHFVGYLHNTFRHLPYNGILLICDNMSLTEQLQVVKFVNPLRSLLQIQPPYTYELPGIGSLLFPVFTYTSQSGLVYFEMMEKTRLPLKTSIEPHILHEELCAYQLFTRGFNGEHDDNIECKVINNYYKALCGTGFDSRYQETIKNWIHSI